MNVFKKGMLINSACAFMASVYSILLVFGTRTGCTIGFTLACTHDRAIGDSSLSILRYAPNSASWGWVGGCDKAPHRVRRVDVVLDVPPGTRGVGWEEPQRSGFLYLFGSPRPRRGGGGAGGLGDDRI